MPLGDYFDIDAEFLAQRCGCSLWSLYCCSDCVRGRGAAVTYLSHNASFHSKKQIAIFKSGIKHNLCWLTEAQMAWLWPYCPQIRGKPRVDNRRVLSSTIFINRNGLC